MKKKIKLTVWMITISLLIAAVLFVLQQHSFSMTEQKIEIDTPQGQLTGTLVLPESYSGTVGLVVLFMGMAQLMILTMMDINLCGKSSPLPDMLPYLLTNRVLGVPQGTG